MRNGYFYNYMSCVEEKRYCDNPEKVVSSLAGSELYLDLLEIFSKRFDLDVNREICQPTPAISEDANSRRKARVLQLALYVAAGEKIRKNIPIDFAAGYSYGYVCAFAQAKMTKFEQVFDDIFSVLKHYSQDNSKAWRDDKLRSMVIADFDDEQIGSYVCNLIEQRYEHIRVKDMRLPHVLQVVGPAHYIEDLRKTIFFEKPGTQNQSTPIIRSDSAHFDGYRYPGAMAVFRALQFGRADFDVYFHSGEPVRAGLNICDPGGALLNSLISPMSMGTIYSEFLREPTQLVMFGSQRVSKFALFGAPSPNDHAVKYLHWESLLLGQDAELNFVRGERW